MEQTFTPNRKCTPVSLKNVYVKMTSRNKIIRRKEILTSKSFESLAASSFARANCPLNRLSYTSVIKVNDLTCHVGFYWLQSPQNTHTHKTEKGKKKYSSVYLYMNFSSAATQSFF